MIIWKEPYFYLETKHTSYIMRILSNGMLHHVYYGAKIPKEDMGWYQLFQGKGFSPAVTVNGLVSSADLIPQEYPSFGRGDYRCPAFAVETADGRRLNELTYDHHEILEEKPALPGLPSLDVNMEESNSLAVTLKDAACGYEVVLHYTVLEEEDVIARHTEIRNRGKDAVYVRRAASLSLDIERDNLEFLSLSGAWGRDRYPNRRPLSPGTTSIESRRGSSSHQLNPFAALASPDATETAGEVYGFSLIYSADFQILTEVSQYGCTRLQAGLNPETFSWKMEAGETFVTPEALMTYSGHGFQEMSHHFHDVCRRHLGRSAARDMVHPIIINSWEAMYFDLSEEKLKQFLADCEGLDIDTFVVDDGWFGRRTDDQSSLGDWFVDEERFPGGLHGVAECCRNAGMKFGIWFEPEMISRDSRLYKAHPDWCIRGQEEPVECRHQLVLDMSRKEVVDGIYEQMAAFIREYDITYIKWDFNRNLTDNGSFFLPPDRQREHTHRYMLGVYSLMHRLTETFPQVFFEGCSGGGGRFDFGIHYYMPQIWTSDDSDAAERLRIQYGTSYAYPPASMVAHVSACPNHQTGRITPFATRGEVAQMCNYGYELAVGQLASEEKTMIREQVRKHRRLDEMIQRGIFYRLCSPFTGNLCAWQMVSEDQKRSYVMAAFLMAEPNPGGQYLRLQGLRKDGQYKVEPLGITAGGETLMRAGIPVIAPQRDYTAFAFELEWLSE